MAGLFSKFKDRSSGPTSPGHASSPSKNKQNAEPEPEITPLQRMLLDPGPLRPDGSDKFFGLENFGNTCYCNAVMQVLYWSLPFREHVVKYPPHSPQDTPNGVLPKLVVPIRPPIQNGLNSPASKPKLTNAEVMKRRAAANSGQPLPPGPGQKAEDKPDSPEYKKKHAMITGPVLDLTYNNSASYGMEESSFTAMKDIFMALIANPSRMGVLSPSRFLDVFKKENEFFRSQQHQDAHEFYGLLLNGVINHVEESAKKQREIERAKKGDQDDGLLKAALGAMGIHSGTRSPGSGWVHEIFEGTLTSETKCLTCETASQRDETFLDLSIDLEQHSSVTSCLRNFSAEEMLCERNKFHCDNCGGLQEAEKRMKIKRLPKILTLHLKRFKYTDDMTGRLQKLHHRVVYPYYLRMFNTTDDAEDPDRLYELYAVVVHIGSNAYHGHYVAIIKTQDRGWLLFDDEMVEPVDKHYVRNFFGDKISQACAYVLFYQETTFEAMRKEQEDEGLAEVALASAEAGIDLGHPQPNGTHPSAISKRVSAPNTPTEDHEEFASLNNAISAPLMPTFATAKVPGLPHTAPLDTPSKAKSKPSKEDKAREQKETKEAEKKKKAEDKAAEKEKAKEKAKADEKRKKEHKELLRVQQEEDKKAIAASKQSAAEEEERRKKENAKPANGGGGSLARSSTVTDSQNGNGEKENPKLFGSLSRHSKNSKSMSRKSFGFLKNDPNPKSSASNGSDDTAVDGEAGPQTPEKNTKSTTARFSFGNLARKKSNLLN